MYHKGIGKTMAEHTITCFWDHGKNKLDIPLGYRNNAATFNLDPGYQNYQEL